MLADDHTLVRTGFRALLRDLTGVEVVAEAHDGREALRLIEKHHPDWQALHAGAAGYLLKDADIACLTLLDINLVRHVLGLLRG